MFIMYRCVRELSIPLWSFWKLGSAVQVLLSVRCKYNTSQHAPEALHRAKFKFPERLKIIISWKWGFTKFNRADHMKLKQGNGIMPDGVNSKLLGCHGPLTNH
ncbi:60S ribosomal protein L10 [Linum perenne]